MKVTIFLAFFSYVSAFIPSTRRIPLNSLHSSISTERNQVEPKNALQELIDMFFEALPLALRTNSKMDLNKVVANPPAFIKPATASQFRRAHKGESSWRVQDIINEFNSKYGVKPSVALRSTSASTIYQNPITFKKEVLTALLSEGEMHEHSVIENAAALDAERFIAEGLTVAFSPLDKPMNRAKLVPKPKSFVKPMTLREIKKQLAVDPDYFHH